MRKISLGCNVCAVTDANARPITSAQRQQGMTTLTEQLLGLALDSIREPIHHLEKARFDTSRRKARVVPRDKAAACERCFDSGSNRAGIARIEIARIIRCNLPQ